MIGRYPLVPNVFWGGVLFPLLVFGFLFAGPTIERRVTGDERFHLLLDRPRDNPWRTGIGAAMITWVAAVFFAGSADRIYVSFGIPYAPQIWFWRAVAIGGPFVTFFLVRRFASELERESP